MSLYKTQHELIQLEVSLEKLESLFSKGEVCASDVHCLNCESKDCIWSMCLACCADRMNCQLKDESISKSCLPIIKSINRNSRFKIQIMRKHLPQLV